MLGLQNIENILNSPSLQYYRNTILSKKLASMALYKFGADWQGFAKRFKKDKIATLHAVFVP
jgi:glutamate dehydrogenase